MVEMLLNPKPKGPVVSTGLKSALTQSALFSALESKFKRKFSYLK